MKAARFYEKNKLVVEDIPLREPLDKEVVIKMHYCGICGADVHIFEGDKGSVDKVIDCAGRVNTAEYAIRYAGKDVQGKKVLIAGERRWDIY